jgi:glucan phosphoethanolaminetransferase (alkaline phosphatase superfamily)
MRRLPTLGQGCGMVSAIILTVICYAFPAASFPWWLKTIIVLLCLVTVAMLLNVRITFYRNKQ